MEPVKIFWEKEITASLSGDLLTDADPAVLAGLAEKARAAAFPSYRMSQEMLLEIPPPSWTHGDVLIYLPAEGWLVRRNYSDYWYVDMGVLRSVGPDLYCWTDLWLDVTLPETADRYRVLDANELSEAIVERSVCSSLLVEALSSFHRLVEQIHQGLFPSPQLREAVEVAYGLRQSNG